LTGSKGSPPRASGQVRAERLDLGQHAVQCRPVQQPVTAGAASAAGSAVVRGDHGGLPARHLHPQGRRPGQGARRRQRDRQVGGELDLRRARSKWRRSGTAAWPSSRFGHVLGRARRLQPRSRLAAGHPSGLGLDPGENAAALLQAQDPITFTAGLTVGVCRVTSCATCSLRSPRATPTGSLPRSAPSSPNPTPRRARTSCPGLPRPGGSPRSGDDQSPAWWQT
jgi:hypothetical protein